MAINSDEKEILKNLQDFLENHPTFTKKCEVVYFMVEIRKIIENNNSFETLHFYCNWVVHNKLSREVTTNYISSLLPKGIFTEKSHKEILKNFKDCTLSFLNFVNLKSDLKKFMFEKELNFNLNSKNWKEFCNILLEELKTSAIEFNVGSKIKIKVENDNGYKYVLFIDNKRIGSEVIK